MISRSTPTFRSRAIALAAKANTPPFRGEIWEDDANVGLAQDSSHGNKPFDINTCIYWKPALQKANHPDTRLIGIQAANQIAKSLICELIARHKIKHDPGHMVLYDQTIEASDDHMKTRFMPFLKSIPAIRDQIEQVIAATSNGRFAVTDTDIRLPGMILRGRPMNESSTQRITIRYMFIHDAAIPGENARNGILRKARIRLTQYIGQELLVVESQGGTIEEEVPDDFTMLMEETDKGELHVTCPCCGQSQNFTIKGWQVRREEDFQATLPHSSRTGSLEEQEQKRAELTKTLKSDARRACGFKRGDELLARMGEGLFNERDIRANTVYECYHCGEHWPDTPEMRDTLQKSSFFVPTNPGASPGRFGFIIPAWICPRIPWGQIMLEKVQADNAKVLGNELLIQEWETKRAATTYDPRRHIAKVASVTATIDPLHRIPDELFRTMDVDCQKDKQLSAVKGEDMTGHFWATAFATDKQGNDVQLWRGYCTSWDEWINKYKELGIPTMNVSVDGGFKPDEVKAMAARHAAKACATCQQEYKDGKPQCKHTAGTILTTWTMMRGSDQHSFRWEDGVAREYRIERPEEATLYDTNGVTRVVKVNVITWSNFRIKNMADAQLRRMPGSPALTVLPDKSALLSERTRLMEVENCTWENQMNSERLGVEDGKKPKWIAVHKENHYRDCLCEHIVKKLQAGVAGRMEVGEQEVQKA